MSIEPVQHPSTLPGRSRVCWINAQVAWFATDSLTCLALFRASLFTSAGAMFEDMLPRTLLIAVFILVARIYWRLAWRDVPGAGNVYHSVEEERMAAPNTRIDVILAAIRNIIYIVAGILIAHTDGPSAPGILRFFGAGVLTWVLMGIARDFFSAVTDRIPFLNLPAYITTKVIALLPGLTWMILGDIQASSRQVIVFVLIAAVGGILMEMVPGQARTSKQYHKPMEGSQ